MSISLSPSQISMLLKCPKQWEFRYVKGLKIPPNGAMMQGSSYHGALKINLTQKITSKTDLPLGDVLDAYDLSWNEILSSDDIGDLENIDWGYSSKDKVKDEGAKLVEIYHKEISPGINPKSVEEKVVLEIDDFSIVGIPDLITTEGIIVDHKMRARMISQEDADKDLAFTAYSFLRGGATKCQFHVAIKSKFRPSVSIVSTERTAEDITWWKGLVYKLCAQVKSGVFPPNPTGWWCSNNFCGYWNFCHGNR